MKVSSESIGLYLGFRDKLDQLIAEAWELYKSQMQCKRGCFSCCENNFHISLIEAHVLREAVAGLPADTREQIRVNIQDPNAPLCPLLVDGACSIYESRPILCRIFGFPVSDGQSIATCELNFTEARDDLFSAKCFNKTALTENTQLLSRLYLHEMGGPELPEGEPSPMFLIQTLLEHEFNQAPVNQETEN
ncbi:MAG: YkgJ family cysteine cluster protein [Cyanobacteria bacterium]|nr:YkgJ family cysteine cluster protein [Cyanobacteriota bacterium]